MTHAPAVHQALHGPVVLNLGLLSGAASVPAIRRGSRANIVHSWRVAHANLAVGAACQFAVAAVMALGWSIYQGSNP